MKDFYFNLFEDDWHKRQTCLRKGCWAMAKRRKTGNAAVLPNDIVSRLPSLLGRGLALAMNAQQLAQWQAHALHGGDGIFRLRDCRC